MLRICIISTLFLLMTCHYDQKIDNRLTFIDIEANINNMKEVNLSHLTDDIQYLKLECVSDFPLNGLIQIDISGDKFLVHNYNICLLYDSEGRFIKKIGTQGIGPGEYRFITCLGTDSGIQQKLFIASIYDLLEYNINGSFVNKYKNVFMINSTENEYIRTWQIIDDSLFLGHVSNTTGRVANKAVLFDKYGNTKKNYKNYSLFDRDRVEVGVFEDFAHINRFNHIVFYKELFCDTMFFLNNKYMLNPKFVFNLGKFKMPVSERARNKTGSNIWNYITLWNVFQTENYLFLDCHFGNRFPAKRLTAKPSKFPGNEPVWINTNYVLGIYYKQTGEFIFIRPSNSDNPLFTTGIYNDIDAGPRFFPEKQINDSTMVMWVKPDELKNHVACEDFKNYVPKYPEKKKELENFANNLSEFDNPVLMFVTFKNRK